VIVVSNRIPVTPGHEEAFEQLFRASMKHVHDQPGFIRNEIHRRRPMKRDGRRWIEDPEGETHHEIKTWWRSLADFEGWVGSESFAAAHRERPSTDMVRGPAQLSIYEVVDVSEAASR